MTLHVANGEEAARRLREAGVEGRILAWPEMLMEGPVPPSLDEDEQLEMRARFLSAYGAYPAKYRADVRALREAMGEEKDEVALWFHDDLFCQLNLLEALRMLGPRDGVTLAHEDAPHGLRSPLSPARAALARRARAAVASADPRAVEPLLAADPAWPRLAVSLRWHLARLPDARDGLGADERALLTPLEAGPRPFRDLFAEFSASDAGRAYGMGDAQAGTILRALAPLVEERGETLQLLPLGRDVLAGRADRVHAGGCDRWIGGVRSRGEWRWDAERRRVVS